MATKQPIVYAQLKHKVGETGFYRSQRVVLMRESIGQYTVRFEGEGKRRKVHIKNGDAFINYLGEKIIVIIEGM